MNRTKRIQFLKKILTPEEFSNLKQDTQAFSEALELYDEPFIESVAIFMYQNKRFLLKKEECSNLLANWQDTLKKLSVQATLQNPVYVSVEKDGTMCID